MTKPTKLRKIPGQARSRQTVEAIVEAGARILVEEGYSRLTTNRVAERAGVSIGSLYQYFGNKDALVCAILERHQKRVRDAMSGDFDRADGFGSYTDVKRLIASVVRAHSVEPKLHAIFDSLRREGVVPADSGGNALARIAARLETLLQTHFGGNAENASLSSWVLVTSVHALVEAHESGDLKCDADRLVDEISRMVFGYVAATQQEQRPKPECRTSTFQGS